jgi:hypothetical protein
MSFYLSFSIAIPRWIVLYWQYGTPGHYQYVRDVSRSSDSGHVVAKPPFRTATGAREALHSWLCGSLQEARRRQLLLCMPIHAFWIFEILGRQGHLLLPSRICTADH